jgi:hypothetical protein
VGWRERDYARWTDAERRWFLGSSSRASLPPTGRDERWAPAAKLEPRRSILRPGFGLVIVASLSLLALGQLPRGHPLLPAFHVTLPTLHRHARTPEASFRVAKRRITKLHGPRSARVGRALDLRGSLPGATGVVRISRTYGGPWRTLRIAALDQAGHYRARIELARRGLLHLQVVYPDGSRAVGSLRVR